MKTVVIVASLVALLAMGYVASFRGLDLRRRSSWVYGLISFLCGIALIIGLNGNLIDGLKAGAIFAFVTLFTGATMRRHKQKYDQDTARSLLLKYGKEDDSSLFAKLVRILLGKYK